MSEIRYTPKRKNKIPEWILTVCVILMIASVLFIAFNVARPIIWQTLFLLAAVAGIWVITRYMTMGFTYKIDPDEGCFLVTQRQGRRLTCLCRLDLALLYRVRKYESRDDNTPRATRYVYCVTPSPKESYLLFFRQDEKTVSVRIECEADFAAHLADIAAVNALAVPESGETDNSDETEAR